MRDWRATYLFSYYNWGTGAETEPEAHHDIARITNCRKAAGAGQMMAGRMAGVRAGRGWLV